MTERETLGLVPDPDFCVVLRDQGFPQEKARFYWVTSGVLSLKGEDVWALLSADELDAHGLTPGVYCFAAPTVEHFMKTVPPRFAVIFAKTAFVFVDLLRTKFGGEGESAKMNLCQIKEGAALTAANSWAQGTCYLLFKGHIKLGEKPKQGIITR